LHRCVRFHDTEYAVYGEPRVGDAEDDKLTTGFLLRGPTTGAATRLKTSWAGF
jgi:hypothetical protein